MFKIIKKEKLNKLTTSIYVEAPLIAKKALPGQFIIFRIDEKGERVPLTIADTNLEDGTVRVIFQHAGRSTMLLDRLNEGDYIKDFVGPLGKATHIEDGVNNICIVGGGVGCAIAFPQAKYLFKNNKNVDIIAGFRNKDFVILEDEMKNFSNNLYINTDDGSYGEKGFVTTKLKNLLENEIKYDLVIAIGPVPMMKAISEITQIYNIKTLVSLNPIMIDGTGMCGGCRVTVGGKPKFACIDGPDFDAHKVDFDELHRRNSFYKQEEIHSRENCHLLEEAFNV